MAFTKLGENLNFSPETNLLSAQEALADRQVAERFVKLAKQLKRIAPRAEDFLYGHAIMMHAAEAALVDQDTGDFKKNNKGEALKGWFENAKVGGKDTVKWVSPDGIRPYKNANGDIFPEAELLKAYKKWVGKPLCKDHKSESVDGIRGIIVDTYYDPKFKRVHALFALDKKNYGDLARKVETGYANCVSMGTAVGRSVCTECSNVATVEREYCGCIKARSNYGEINLDLNPIELSLVVNGADGLAKIRNVIASMNNYVASKQASVEKMKADRCVNPTELQALADAVGDIQSKLKSLMPLEKVAENDSGDDARMLQALRAELDKTTDPSKRAELEAKIEALVAKQPGGKPAEAAPATMGGGEGYAMQAPQPEPTNISLEPSNRLASIEGDQTQGALVNEIGLLRSKLETMNKDINDLRLSISKEEKNMNSARLRARAKARRAYWLGGGGVNEPTPGKPKYEKEDAETIREKEDKQMVGEPLETGSEGMHPGDEAVKKKMLRAEELADRKLKREALVKEVSTETETKLTEAELESRRLNRRAYWQGGGGLNEPTPGKPKYPKEDAESIREKEDKHMVGEGLEPGSDGLAGDDLKVKQHWLRAKLRAKLTKVADDKGNIVKGASKWEIFAGDDMILSATATEAFEDEVDENWDFFTSKEYGKEVMKSIRSEGFDRTAYLLKGAQPPAAPAPEAALPAPAPAAPEAAAPAPAPEAAAPAPAAEPKDGAMLDKVNAALSTMEEKIAEIRDLVSGSGNELVDVDVNVGGDKAAAPAAAPMDSVLASSEDMLKVEALLDEAADELALISETLESLDKVEAAAQAKLLKAAGEALVDSGHLVAEADLVIESAKKKKDKKKDKKEDKKEMKEEKADKEEKKEEKAEKKEEKKDDKEAKAQELLDKALKARAENRAALLKAAMGMGMDEAAMMALSPQEEGKVKNLLVQEEAEGHQLAKDKKEDKEEKEDEKDEDVEVEEDEKDEDDAGDGLALPMMAGDGAAMCAHGPDEAHDEMCAVASTKTADSRKAARAQLVAEAGEILGKYELDLGKAQNATEPTYFKAHPGGKGTATELTHSKTKENVVETISEVHDAMRDVAESGPRNVREAAMELQENIVKGAMTAADIDRLVAEGKVDAAAAAYWKKFWGQAPGAGSFGADLSKEFASKKKEASDNGYRVKLRRAYDIGLAAQEKGLIASTRDALDTYVDEIMHFDDAAFESNKRVVANYKASKKSGALPRVGLDAAGQAMNVTASAEPSPEPNLTDLLGNLGWK